MSDFEKLEQLARLTKDWVWVTGVERFIHRASGRMLKASQFDSEFNRLQPRVASLSKELFKGADLKRFARLAYRPTRPEFDGDCYNQWRASPIIAKEGDARLWEGHLFYLFPDEATRSAVLDWMAWTYQNQFARPNQALLIVGETGGTGKSAIARVYEGIIGKDNTSRPKASSITGDFNSWAFGKKLVLIEELKRYEQAGRREVAHELRDIISEPTIEVNLKHIPHFQVENYCALLALSNYPDAVNLVEKDRRWLVAGSPVTDERKAEYQEEWGENEALWNWLDPKGDYSDLNPAALAAIAWQLKTRDVSAFKPGEATMTDAKAEMILRSRSPLEQAALEYVRESGFTLFTMDDIWRHIPDPIKHRAPASYQNIIGDSLRRMFKAERSKQLRISGDRERLWGVREGAAAIRRGDAGETLRDLYLAERKSAPDDFSEAAE